MKKYFWACLMLGIAVSGCQLDPQPSDDQAIIGKEYIAYTEAFSELTKTAIDGNYSVLWSAGDEVAIFEGITYPSRYAVHESAAGTPNGAFTKVDNQTGGFVSGNEIPVNIAVYPYSSSLFCVNGDTDGVSYIIKKVNVPAEQSYQAGSFDNGSFVMAAVTRDINDNLLRFKNACGAFQLQLTGTAKIKEIVLAGNSDELIAGNAVVTVYSDGTTFPLMTMEADAAKSIRLDCGDGVQLDPNTPTSFFITLAPTAFTGGFTVQITDTEGGTAILKTTKTNTVNRSKTLRMPPVRFEPVPAVTGPADLSAEGTANCYIVKESGSYKFKAVKGNSDESVGAVASAEVLWESLGISKAISSKVTISEGDLIQDAAFADDYISFSVPETFVEGNAVIAAKDASGTILWSWHIWLVNDEIVEHVYANNAGIVMDRNLGATSAGGAGSSLEEAVRAIGLYYQWGRKDPFIGLGNIWSNSAHNRSETTLAEYKAVDSDATTGTIEYSIKNPTVYINKNSSTNDWLNEAKEKTRWAAAKTIYDPCPVGWKVPEGNSSGLWGKAGIKGTYSFDRDSRGMTVPAELCSQEAWYPAGGMLKDGNRVDSEGGNYGYYYSATCISGGKPYRFGYINTSNKTTVSVYTPDSCADSKSLGYSIRCCRE